MTAPWDIIVVGGGNAGLCAAHSARQEGARVLVLEKAPRRWAGGNTYFTAGAMRTSHGGPADLEDLLAPLEPSAQDRLPLTDLAPYTDADFLDDMVRVTRGRTDTDLARILVGESRATMDWLRDLGLRFELMYHRQAYEVDGRHRFWGGLAVGVAGGGGKGMIEQHLAAAERTGVHVRFDAPVIRLATASDGTVNGVVLAGGEVLESRAVVLAAGGFEADPQMRAAHLGPGWDLALVRGTPYNTGADIRMALDAGAQAYGHWSGGHAVAWDAGARPTGDRELTNQLTRGGYPFGIVVNTDGRRFVDEDGTAAPGGVRLGGRHQCNVRQRTGTGPGTRHRREPTRLYRGGVQRRDHGRPLQPYGQGRQPHRRLHPVQVQLGPAPRHAALHRLSGHLRHHLHLRRPAHRPRRTRPQHPRTACT
ncbi:FAD-dependent oxidoreductase, partial [Streptomyces sp. MCAF7]